MRAARLLKFSGALLIIFGLALPLADRPSREAILHWLAKVQTSTHTATQQRQQPPESPSAIPEPVASPFDQAKRIIPARLNQIFAGLNQGNLSAVRPFVSQQLANDYGKLDSICKPFTYRAHYIEAIIERPNGWFEARVRVLFQPLDERAYVLSFSLSQAEEFFLNGVADPTDDWFGPEKQTAAEIARNFIYAAKARRTEELASLVAPGMPTSAFATDPCWQQFFIDVQNVGVSDGQMKSYKGLLAEIDADLRPAAGFGYWDFGRGHFFIDRLPEGYRIVVADPRGEYRRFWRPQGICDDQRVLQKVEDPNLEQRTLGRFGLAAPLVSSPTETTLKPAAPLLQSPLDATLKPDTLSTAGLEPAKKLTEVYHVDDVLTPHVSGVSAPSALYKIEPEYSDEARRAHFSGVVSVSLLVDANGNPERIRVVQSPGLGLDAKVIDALQKWRFQPGLEEGTGTPLKVRVTIDFTFQNK